MERLYATCGRYIGQLAHATRVLSLRATTTTTTAATPSSRRLVLVAVAPPPPLHQAPSLSRWLGSRTARGGLNGSARQCRVGRWSSSDSSAAPGQQWVPSSQAAAGPGCGATQRGLVHETPGRGRRQWRRGQGSSGSILASSSTLASSSRNNSKNNNKRSSNTNSDHNNKNSRSRRSAGDPGAWLPVGLGLTLFGLGGPSREERRRKLKQEADDAIRKSNMAALRRVIKRAVEVGDVELRDELDRSIAAVAASKGKLEPLRFLISQGADPSAVDKHGISVLAYAAWKGQSVVVEYLLKECGLAPEGCADVFGLHPMHKAAGYGQAGVLRLLLAAGADVNLPTAEVTAPPSYEAKSKLETALAIAARLGFHSAMRVLLSQPRVRVDQQDRHGDTPLHWAARKGDWRGVQILISAGADSSVQNRAGKTPVEEAPSGLRVAMVTGTVRLYPSKFMAWLDPTWRDELP